MAAANPGGSQAGTNRPGAKPAAVTVSPAPGRTTAARAGRALQYSTAGPAPSSKFRVGSAPGAAAVGATQLALAVPLAGHPVRGSSRCPSFRPLYSKSWNVAADVANP